MQKPKIAIIMGSDSDKHIALEAAKALDLFDIAYSMQVISAHRTPEEMIEFGKNAAQDGYSAIIALAGGAAHLPGMLSSVSTLPVIGVPVSLKNLSGLDSLLSIVQMPKGVPVATVAIDAGFNAGILAAQIIASSENNSSLQQKLLDYKQSLVELVRKKNSSLNNG